MKDNYFYFITLSVFTILLSYTSKNILNIDNLVLNTYTDKLTIEQLNQTIEFKEKWEWATYLLVPVLLFIKISLIALVINIGLFFFEKYNKVKYSKLFNIVVKAEFIFLLVLVTKTIWFYYFQKDFTLEDLQYFYPFSVLNIVGYQDLEPWYIYPLQTLNAFEMIYWLLLGYLLAKELKTNFDNGLKVVISTYSVALLIWVVVVMFITLNIS